MVTKGHVPNGVLLLSCGALLPHPPCVWHAYTRGQLEHKGCDGAQVPAASCSCVSARTRVRVRVRVRVRSCQPNQPLQASPQRTKASIHAQHMHTMHAVHCTPRATALHQNPRWAEWSQTVHFTISMERLGDVVLQQGPVVVHAVSVHDDVSFTAEEQALHAGHLDVLGERPDADLWCVEVGYNQGLLAGHTRSAVGGAHARQVVVPGAEGAGADDDGCGRHAAQPLVLDQKQRQVHVVPSPVVPATIIQNYSKKKTNQFKRPFQPSTIFVGRTHLGM